MGTKRVHLCKENAKELLNQLIEYGVTPMLKDILGDALRERTDNINIMVLDSITFSKLLCVCYHDQVSQQEKEKLLNEDDKAPQEKIDALIKNRSKQLELTDGCINTYVNYSGFAYNRTIILNDGANDDFGLHLICHELMHIIADKEAVQTLRFGTNHLGDEAINEFFARLASLYFYDKEKSEEYVLSTRVPGCQPNDTQHEEEGCYNKLIKQDCRINAMEKIISDAGQNDSAIRTALVSLASFYFKGSKCYFCKS